MTPPTPPTVEPRLTLDRDPPDYAPGETLHVEAPAEVLVDAQSAELSVVWYTAGKGDEDMGVHDFDRRSLSSVPTDEPLTLETVLPASPLSYAGRVVKVCWCARLRLFLPRGKQLVIEAPLRLGAVAPLQSTEDESSEQARNA